MDMNLCIDEGNTALKFGIFEGNKLLHSGIGVNDIQWHQVQKTIISTVVVSSNAIKWCEENSTAFHLLSYKSKLPFSIKYSSPETLGNDRLAAIAGATLHFPNQNTLVIVMGTCITYNFVDAENCFWGGAISPGSKLRFKAMNQFTSRLPMIEWDGKLQSEFIGDSTHSSMISGVSHGILHEIKGTIKSFEERFANLNIILTGGDTAFLVSQLKNNIFARPELLLEGLNHILNHNDN